MAVGTTEPSHPRTSDPGRSLRAASAALSLYALYWVVAIVPTAPYRASFLLVSLVLIACLYAPVRAAVVMAAAAAASLGYFLFQGEAILYRAATPTALDIVAAFAAFAVVLEATRRTTGWILPAVAAGFFAYAFAGPWLPGIVAHRGYDAPRLAGSLFMTLEGLFGVPLDVAATYIILFTIFGAVLEQSKAGWFFVEWARAVMTRTSSRAAPGRAVTLAGFLLGTVSGSGVATTVMLGSVSWPMLRRAGYGPETAGGMLSAAGIGALISPPTLGAAAFLIAEYLEISYFQVLVMATIPTLLYYASLLVTVEIDASRLALAPAEPPPHRAGELARRYGYHFISLAAIGVFMATGMTAFRAVFLATVLAVALSWVRRDTALTPSRLWRALSDGAVSVLPIVATTATAGMIVGIVTLTGLGLKSAGLIVSLAGGTTILTIVFAAIAVWMLGLAVPVTASYIIAAVMVAPALVAAGVAPIAAHMFIFYYAVLSEVSPPTALAPFAAAAVTGGDPQRTLAAAWKYTAPAFLVPIAFTIAPEGLGLLGQGAPLLIALTSLTALAGVVAIAAALGRRRLWPLLLAGGLALLYPAWWADLLGTALAGLTLFAARTENV
ncbi:MAG: TRAP transporter fused permease subunit [Acidobacteriota bacterium]|nr:TRAP transporter fused permease subunit [Acidobacteriota bacterium]